MELLLRASVLAACSAALSTSLLAAQPWQQVTNPTVAEAAASFANPPTEYAAIHWAIWGGQQSKDRITADIERIHANGGGVYMINNSRGLRPKYLTPEYMDLVKTAVEECKKRGMKVWIEGDAGYPDGFAGGLISKDHPELGMQGIIADARYTLKAGETLNVTLPPDVLGIVATTGGAAEIAADAKEIPLPADGKFKWIGPSGTTSEVVFQGAAGEPRYAVVAGQTLALPIPAGTTKILSQARSRPAGGGRGGAAPDAAPAATIVPVPASGKLEWKAPADGPATLTLVRHLYRSSPTRFVNREDDTNDKDSLYALIDYLDPKATDTYLDVIYSQYEKLVGDEFGKTVLGFRGDETDFTGFLPWTPKLLETFKAQKGYDLQPYVAGFFSGQLSTDAQRAKADYFDVWSGMFRDNFYQRMQAWCEKRNMQFMVHLNHEELMVNTRGEDLIKNEGSFFRDMRFVGVPGVDNLGQIAPGIIADFPKLAGSTAHLYGRPLVWDEEGGGTGRAGKFVVDYQLVRGINYMNIRGMTAAASPDALQTPADAMGHYVSRAEHLLALGKPVAKIALFHATDSYWLGGPEAADADAAQLKITTELVQNQRDFDHIDSDTLAALPAAGLTPGGPDGPDAGLVNNSGNYYKAIIIPSSTVIQKSVLDRLRQLTGLGTKVLFVGRTPTMVVDKTFLHPEPAPDLSFATLLEPTAAISDKVIAALPAPDVKLDQPCPAISYIHRSLKDGEVYFLFNESADTQSRNVTLSGAGDPQWWDPATGETHALTAFAHSGQSTTVPLSLAGQESRFLILAPTATAAAAPAIKVLAALDGDWSITLADKNVTSPLKSWQDLGVDNFTGIAHYHKSFTAPTAAGPITLDLGNVREVARITLNGQQFPPRSWAPSPGTSRSSPAKTASTSTSRFPRPNRAAAVVGVAAAVLEGQDARAAGLPAQRPPPAGNPTANEGTPPAPARAGARGRGAPAAGASLVRTATSGLLGPVRLITQ